MSTDAKVPFIRIVLLNFNGGTSVLGAVAAAVASDWPSDRLEVVCVDNGSSDGSIERIEAEYPEVHVVRNGANLGFPGNNAAMQDLRGVDYVALVNSDAFVEAGWLAPLVASAEEDRGIGAVCPKILFNGDFVEVPLALRSSQGHHARPIRLRSLHANGRDAFCRCHVAAGGGRSSDSSGLFEWIADGSVLRFPLRQEDREKGVLAFEFGLEVDAECDLTIGGVTTHLDGAGVRHLVTGVFDPIPPTVSVLNNVGSWLDRSWIGHERGLT